MANPETHMREGPFRPSIETDRLLNATGLAERVVNLEPTPEGTLRTVSGPALLVDEADVDVYGIGHCVVRGKELIVRQTSDRLQVFRGWESTKWHDLTDPAGAAGTLKTDLSVNNAPKYPPIFIPTPTGLIIIPAGSRPRSLFYDGDVLEYLGFSQTPSAPLLRASQAYESADLLFNSAFQDRGARVGDVVAVQGSTLNDFRRERGQYEGVVQWIDRRGDLSPISGRSARVDVPLGVIAAGNNEAYGLFRITWFNIPTGPSKTIGRILGRTRSLVTSGTAELFEVPQHVAPASSALSTVPDNVTTLYSDNNSESALFVPMLDVAPMPVGRVATIAMGRLWIAAEDGALWYSEPGRWGTFLRDSFVYPDAAGGEPTGLLAVPGGAVATTQSSTYFITPNDEGTGFKSAALSSRYGCVAPASMGMLPDGTALWLSREGFVTLRDGTVVRLPEDHDRLMRQVNPGRMLQSVAVVAGGAYTCWVPFRDSRTPDLGLVFDGSGWRRRTDSEVRHVAVTDDYRGYVLFAGKDASSGRSGVLVLDRESTVLGTQSHVSELETAWIGVTSTELKSLRRLVVWGREAGLQDITVEIMRDWREGEIVDTVTVPMNQPEDVPDTWDNAPLDAPETYWERRRPFFGVVDLDIPSAQSLKFRFKATSSMDFIGFELQTQANITSGSWA